VFLAPTDRCSGSAVVSVGEATSIAEGFERFARAGQPFIVRNVKAFDLDYDAFRARMVREGLKTFAWDRSLEEVKDIPISDALSDWERGMLKVNFVDSPIPKFVPNAGILSDLLDVGIDEDRLMLVMTQRGGYTPFHQDPIAGSDSGGGWMWLLRGRKVWNFLHRDLTDEIFCDEANSVVDPHVGHLVTNNHHALWGKVGQVIAEAGDFVYFPPGCNHRVWTYEDSIGVGGYARFDFDEQRIAKGCEWYKSKGIRPEDGMFQIVGPKRAKDAVRAMMESNRHGVAAVCVDSL
jgi:hypothetical protein